MRYLLYKELRLLTPLVLLLIVLQGMLLCFLGTNNSPYGHLPVFVAILSSVAFMLETEYGTMDELLVQPVSRQRVWVVKIGAVLLCVVVLINTLHVLAGYVNETHLGNVRSLHLREEDIMFFALGLFLLFFAPTAGLMLRNIFIGLLLSGAVIVAMLMGDDMFVTNSSLYRLEFDKVMIFTCLALTIPCCWWAISYWKRYEPSRPLSGFLPSYIPSFAGLSGGYFKPLYTIHCSRPWLNLWWKEFYYQRVALILAMIFSAAIIWCHVGSPYFSREEFNADLIWAFCVVVPLALGTWALPREKALGMMEWHRQLPVSENRYGLFRIGLLMGMVGFLILLMGGLSSLMLIQQAEARPYPLRAFIWMHVPQAALIISISIIGYYVASCVRGRLMSLGMTVLFCMGIFALGYIPGLAQDSQSNWLIWLAPIGFAVSYLRVWVVESMGAFGYLGLLVGSWCAWLLLALWFGHRNQRYSYHSMGTYLRQGVVLVFLGGVIMQCVIALYFAMSWGGSRNLMELGQYIYGL